MRVRPLRPRERDAALAYLDGEGAARLNLGLADLVLRLGTSRRPGEARPQVLAAWREDALVGLAGIQPTVLLDATVAREALEAFFPYLAGVGSSLVKSTEDVVGPLWSWLESRGRRALLDRIEYAYAAEPARSDLRPTPRDLEVRSARDSDLEPLVEAARHSLLEEGRPDPSLRDPIGFRRWVASRIPRAVVAERAGRIGFVGYADVQCPRGWLLQGVYTFPELRREGVAAAGVSELCRRAFATGAEHVQLAVVEGNAGAARLYESLGFRRFARLRTLLFA